LTTSNATIRYLWGQRRRLMTKWRDSPWPPRSPDLTGFFFGATWSNTFGMCHMHDQQPNNLRELREAIVTAYRNLDPQMIRNSFNCMLTHMGKKLHFLLGGMYFPMNSIFIWKTNEYFSTAVYLYVQVIAILTFNRPFFLLEFSTFPETLTQI
jgi:hypothetical protein